MSKEDTNFDQLKAITRSWRTQILEGLYKRRNLAYQNIRSASIWRAASLLLQNLCQRLLGLIPVLTVCVFVAESSFNAGMRFMHSPIAIVYIPFSLVGITIGFAAIAISTIRAAKWIRKAIGDYWSWAIPPHDDIERSHSFWELFWGTSPERKSWWTRVDRLPFPHRKGTLYCTFSYGALAYFLYFLALSILVLITRQGSVMSVIDVQIGQNVATPIAFISLFAGQIVGTILLGAASFVSSGKNLLALVLLIGIPMFGAAPAARNFIEWSEYTHRRVVESISQHLKYPVIGYILTTCVMIIVYVVLSVMITAHYAPRLVSLP